MLAQHTSAPFRCEVDLCCKAKLPRSFSRLPATGAGLSLPPSTPAPAPSTTLEHWLNANLRADLLEQHLQQGAGATTAVVSTESAQRHEPGNISAETSRASSIALLQRQVHPLPGSAASSAPAVPTMPLQSAVVHIRPAGHPQEPRQPHHRPPARGPLAVSLGNPPATLLSDCSRSQASISSAVRRAWSVSPAPPSTARRPLQNAPAASTPAPGCQQCSHGAIPARSTLGSV